MMSVAMVWGANGGIGRALIEELQAKSWRVLGVARDAVEIGDSPVVTIEADVANPAEVEQAVIFASQVASQVDLWIYAIGDILSSRVAEIKPEEFSRVLNANLMGAYFSLHYSLPLLSDNAHIIFLGAYSERLRLPGLSAYAAAKAGLEAFAESFAKEERKRRVTLVRPSAVVTPLWEKMPLKIPPNAMHPKEIAKVILEAHESGQKGNLDV